MIFIVRALVTMNKINTIYLVLLKKVLKKELNYINKR